MKNKFNVTRNWCLKVIIIKKMGLGDWDFAFKLARNGPDNRGVMIHVFVLNLSVRGFRFSTHYEPNDSLD